MWFWNYKSGHNFQQAQTIVQPGILFIHLCILSYFLVGLPSFIFCLYIVDGFTCNHFYIEGGPHLLKTFMNCCGCVARSFDSEARIHMLSFDQMGSRLITCEVDKIIKFWKEDENATRETHLVHFRPPKEMGRF